VDADWGVSGEDNWVCVGLVGWLSNVNNDMLLSFRVG
jgi:hypothetical protein